MKGQIISVTMEIALEGSANFAGGLGVLEADKFYGAARLGLPYTVITPFYPNGYVDWDYGVRGKLVEVRHRHSLSFLSKLKYLRSIEVRKKDGGLLAEVDIYEFSYGSARVLLYRIKRPLTVARLFRYLYRHHHDECTYYITAAAVASEIIKKVLAGEGISVIDVQEAHLALVPYLLPNGVRTRFITHTPGPWGHPKLCKDAEEILGISLPNVKTMTEAAMEIAEKVFTVSKKHFEVTKMFFPKYIEKMSYITNAIDLDRWQRIKKDPGSSEELRKIHEEFKQELSSIIRALSGKPIGDRLIVSWVRRIVKYKRPYFIEWLVEENGDLKDMIFIVTSGKPHPNDEWGKEMATTFSRYSRALPNFFYYPSYGTEFAYYALSSSDLLLFTPFSCWEASGTSMMKAGANGVPTLSSRDGASLELIVDGVNGWFFGKELTEFIDIESEEARRIDEEDYRDFVKKLEYIIDLYERDKTKYYEIAYNAYKTFTPVVDITRLLKQYYSEFFPSKPDSEQTK